MAGKQKYTAEEVVEALRVSKGMVYMAARRLGCEAKTVYNYAERYASVRAEMEQQDGVVDDTAELKLIEAIHRGEAWAIKYRLSTKGKKRGYVERQEVSGPEGGPIQEELTVKPVDYRNGLQALAPHDGE